MRVVSKVGNLPSKFGHARHLGSQIICYVRDGRMDTQTDKSNAFPAGGGIISCVINKALIDASDILKSTYNITHMSYASIVSVCLTLLVLRHLQ